MRQQVSGRDFKPGGRLEMMPLSLFAIVLLHHEAFVKDHQDHPEEHIIIACIKQGLKDSGCRYATYEGWAATVRADHQARQMKADPIVTEEGGVLPLVGALANKVEVLAKEVSADRC